MSVELKPIKTKKIYEEIVEQIKQLIIDGQIRAGDKLPSERQLIESFRVSRASIREALSALEMMGLLEIRTGEGAYIRQHQTDSMAASLTWAVAMEKNAVLELLEIRKMLEVQAAGQAAERATKEDLDIIERLLAGMRLEMYSLGSIGEKSDYLFHYNIAKATHNNITIRLMGIISDYMKHLFREIRMEKNEGKYNSELLFQDYENIFLSLQNRDANKARKRMKVHLDRVEEQILKVIR